MTTFDTRDFAGSRAGSTDLVSGQRRFFASMRRWQEHRQTLAQLSLLDEHVLRDAGLDPDDVRDALKGDDALLWQKLRQQRRMR